MKPAWTLQEAYRFRVTGEGFNGDPGHVRWVQRDGMWYQATWVDYDIEAEHGIDGIQVDNPRLPLYVPNPFGGQHSIPVPSADNPVIVSGG